MTSDYVHEQVSELKQRLLSAMSWHRNQIDEGLMAYGKIINMLAVEDHERQSLWNAYYARAHALNKKRTPEPTTRLD